MNPVQAANIVLGVWEMLHGAVQEPVEGPPAPVAELPAKVDLDLTALQERCDRLVLVVHGMWALMTEKMGITDADLVSRMADLDAADGTVDGRVTAPPVRCSCGAMVCRKLKRCLFCGKPYKGGTTFDTL